MRATLSIQEVERDSVTAARPARERHAFYVFMAAISLVSRERIHGACQLPFATARARRVARECGP